MNRLLLVPVAALLAATGCVNNSISCPPGFAVCGGVCVDLLNDPLDCGFCGNVCASGSCNAGACGCPAPNLLVYWTPGPPPTGGFQVPGLVAAGFPAQLGCSAAGVAGVQVSVGATVVPCTGAGNCVDVNTWRCTVGGVSIPIASGGTYVVGVDAFGTTGNFKFTSTDSIGAFSCGDTAAGVFPQGLTGTLGIDYAFSESPFACQSGSTIEWDLRSGLATPFDTGSIACGTTNPFNVYGGFAVPAGVYTLFNIAEVAGATSVHALCSFPTFVHAGNESGAAALVVDMPHSTMTCF